MRRARRARRVRLMHDDRDVARRVRRRRRARQRRRRRGGRRVAVVRAAAAAAAACRLRRAAQHPMRRLRGERGVGRASALRVLACAGERRSPRDRPRTSHHATYKQSRPFESNSAVQKQRIITVLSPVPTTDRTTQRLVRPVPYSTNSVRACAPFVGTTRLWVRPVPKMVANLRDREHAHAGVAERAHEAARRARVRGHPLADRRDDRARRDDVDRRDEPRA